MPNLSKKVLNKYQAIQILQKLKTQKIELLELDNSSHLQELQKKLKSGLKDKSFSILLIQENKTWKASRLISTRENILSGLE